MSSDPNVKIKKYFDDFYPKAMEAAEKQAGLFIDSLQLSKKPLESQITCLNEELLSIKDDIDVFDRKEYIHFAKHKEIILNIYSSRVLLLGVNERSLIEQALIFSSKKNEIIRLINDLKSQLPAFSFSAFLKNENNTQFYSLRECPNGVSQDEYTKMKNFQTQKKFECVQTETSKLLKAFFSDIESNDEQTFIDQEKIQIAFIFKNATEWNSKRLFSEITKLKGINSDELNVSLDFYDDFLLFCNGKILNCKLSPGYFTETLKQLKNNQHSNPPIFCISLAAYESCLCEIEKGNTTLSSYLINNYEDVFVQTYNDGIRMAENQIKLFSSNSELDSITPEKYAEAIINELNHLRSKFKAPNIADYYNYLHDNESLKALFLNNCLFAEEVEPNINALKQAIVINEMVCFLLEEVVEIESISPDFKLSTTNFEFILQIFQLQIHMAPSSDILNQLLNILSDTFSKLKNPETPLWFIIEDFKDAICDVYQQSENNLIEILKLAESENSKPFIADKIRDLNIKLPRKNILDNSLLQCIESLRNVFDAQLEYLKLKSDCSSSAVDLILNENIKNEEIASEKIEFLPRQSDFRGTGRSPVSYSDIRKPDLFSKFEIDLFESGLIDEKYNFTDKHGNKNFLAALYKILIAKRYFREINSSNGKSFEPHHFRQYLDHRYSVDTTQQFKNCTSKQIDSFKYKYNWVQNIDFCR